MIHKCRVCGDILDATNWSPSNRKHHSYTCKKCAVERMHLWREAHPEKAKANWTRYNREQGKRPMSKNKECSSYLGIHIAERVLSYTFKNVEVMPHDNPGYDFICNKGMKIDVKSSCLRKIGDWMFTINHNTTADYFLCLSFDNREDLTPLHAWLLPGAKFNHLAGASIRPSTIHKWDEYRIDISKVSACCNTLKENKSL